MIYIVLLGRILYSAIFIFASINQFSPATFEYAAKEGVPLAMILVPLSGVLSLLGGLSILLGYKARLGAWFLVIFLLPVTFMLHQFWKISDPMMAMMEQATFMRNLALLGTAFMIAYFGTGPLSLEKSKKTK